MWKDEHERDVQALCKQEITSASRVCQGPRGVLPASLGEGWEVRYGQAGGHEVGPAVLLSFTTSLQPLGQDFLLRCQAPSEGIPWCGR